ncbi:MAG: hypothetical protein ACRYGP_33520 [Janthinobacterium lividum]
MALKLLDKPRLRRGEASSYLEQKHGVTVAVATLAKYATVGGGPAFNLFGRFPFYEPAALDTWVAQKLGRAQVSTSDAGRV